MKLKVGDELVCVKVIGALVYGKTYKVIHTRLRYGEEDICIESDWWFGQIGYTEPWTDFFTLDKQCARNKKLEELGL